MLIVLTFFVAFTFVALLLTFLTSGSRKGVKQTLARLDAIRTATNSADHRERPIDVRREDFLSTLAWLDRLLQKAAIGTRLRALLAQADVRWPVGRLILISVSAAVIGSYAVYLRTEGLLPALGFGMAAGALPFAYVLRQRSARFDKFRQLLPDALDQMVSAIRAGQGFAAAMGVAAKESSEPIRRELRQCYDEQNFGLDLRFAMTNLAERVPIHEVRIIVTAVLIQKESGGNLTEILENVAKLIRESFRLQRQIRVHTAQGRLTGWILSLLPVGLGCGLYLVNPKNMSVLWTRPVGLKMMYGAAISTMIGGLIIRRIVRIQV